MTTITAARTYRAEVSRTDTRWPVVVVVAFAAVWLAVVWPRIGAPLGLNHDGQNAGVFGSSARALVDAPLGSRLGSRLADGHGIYADHPPLLNWLLALGHLVRGDDPSGLRLPLTVGSMILIAGTHRVLRALVTSPWAAAIGTVVGLGTPMFFVYGTMPDTPMLGLPFGVLVLGEVIATERRTAKHPGHLVLAALGCALASWEAVVLAAALGTVSLGRARRGAPCDRATHRTIARRVFTGLAVGGVVTASWIAWANGGFAEIARQFLYRTGADGTEFGVGRAALTQLEHLMDTYGPVLVVALVAGGAAMRVPRLRGYLTVVAVVCVSYQLVFWQAATYHDYWSYWWLLPMAMSIAGLVDVTVASADLTRRQLAGALAVLALIGPVATLARPTHIERSYDDGVDIATLLLSVDRPADQHRLLTVGLGTPNSWASWPTHLPVQQVGLAELHRLARVHPRWMVLGYCNAPRADHGPPLCSNLPADTPRAGDAVVIEVARLDAALATT